jgi:hypothetical protein
VQIPDPRRHLVRYYGAYSNASRGKRKKATAAAEPSPAEACTTVVEAFPSARLAAVVAPDGQTAAFRIDRQGPHVIEEDA